MQHEAPQDSGAQGSGASDAEISTPDQPQHGAPLSVVPHEGASRTVAAPVHIIRTNRYGHLEEHELIKLLDTIEDERARGRFRESIYISLIIWLAVAWVLFYGRGCRGWRRRRRRRRVHGFDLSDCPAVNLRCWSDNMVPQNRRIQLNDFPLMQRVCRGDQLRRVP